jgi:hypothetical protein
MVNEKMEEEWRQHPIYAHSHIGKGLQAWILPVIVGDDVFVAEQEKGLEPLINQSTGI